jgi:signal peptidase II
MAAMKDKLIYLIITAVALAADQVTKAWATASLRPIGSVQVLEGFFNLSYARNRGVAFSLFADAEFEVRWILAAISALAAAVVIVYLMQTAASKVRLNTALALLLAGITGNLVDRVRLGEVVDFLDFHWGHSFSWPTFNVADTAICIGAVLLALEIVKEEKVAHPEPQAVGSRVEESRMSSSE